ncbi:hypothetical protein ACSQ67_010456 [Phaseolus vulgaris]
MGCYASAIAKLPPECFISDHYGKSFSWFGSWNGIHDCPLYTSTKLPQPRSEGDRITPGRIFQWEGQGASINNISLMLDLRKHKARAIPPRLQ